MFIELSQCSLIKTATFFFFFFFTVNVTSVHKEINKVIKG